MSEVYNREAVATAFQNACMFPKFDPAKRDHFVKAILPLCHGQLDLDALMKSVNDSTELAAYAGAREKLGTVLKLLMKGQADEINLDKMCGLVVMQHGSALMSVRLPHNDEISSVFVLLDISVLIRALNKIPAPPATLLQVLTNPIVVTAALVGALAGSVHAVEINNTKRTAMMKMIVLVGMTTTHAIMSGMMTYTVGVFGLGVSLGSLYHGIVQLP
jgi:fumarate reductase subunit C